MENPTLSIDRILQLRGQLGLALFFGAFTTHSPAFAELAVVAELQQLASAGYLQQSHWLGKNLNPQNRSEWVLQSSAMGVYFTQDRWQWQMARTNQGYLRANPNALLLAAQDEANSEVDLSTPGKFELRAEVWTLKATTFSAVYNLQLTDGLAVELEPHVHLIHDFQHTKGELLLLNTGGSSQLVGQIAKTGTRRYGFLPEEQRDEGIGAGLHLRSSWRNSWGLWGASIRNLWSQLRFDVVHQQNREYNVIAQGNKLKIADYPSVTGHYGVVRTRENLPMHWQVFLSPAQLVGASFGLLGFGNEVRWTALYSLPAGGGQIWTKTVQAQNWTLGYSKPIGSDWKFALGVSADARLNGPALSTMSLTKTW